jgi:phage terminase large subunit GpA-like protein
MSQLFQPPPPPCAKCGTTTVIASAIEEGQRLFAIRCPACGHDGTYSLDYDTLREGAAPTITAAEPRAALVA